MAEHVCLDLPVGEAGDQLIHDHRLSVGDVLTTLCPGALDGVSIDNCKTPHSAGEFPDGLPLVLSEGAEFNSVHSLVPLAHGNLLQLGKDDGLSGGGGCPGSAVSPVMISPQRLSAALHQLCDDIITLQASGLFVISPPGLKVSPVLFRDIRAKFRPPGLFCFGRGVTSLVSGCHVELVEAQTVGHGLSLHLPLAALELALVLLHVGDRHLYVGLSRTNCAINEDQANERVIFLRKQFIHNVLWKNMG